MQSKRCKLAARAQTPRPGRAWIHAGLPAIVTSTRTGSVQVSALDNPVLHLGTEGSGIFKSTDRAASWFSVNAGLDDLNVMGIAMDPHRPSVVYASTFSSVFNTTTGGQ